jgi:pyrroline-5-carboxylate reductase
MGPLSLNNLMKLVLIGCGNMGSAIVRALLKNSESIFASVEVFDHNSDKSGALGELGCTVVPALSDLEIDDSTVVLAAVKPQNMDELLQSLNGRFAPDALLVSIAAGVSIERLTHESGHQGVVRVMPNTPILVGEGASGWMAAPSVNDAQKQVIQRLFESFGAASEVKSEDQLDMVTALSGCGPAYVFYFLEALIQGATKLGLSTEEAHHLAVQTLQGGLALAKDTSSIEDLQTLRANVTSKGGSTEQAIGVMDESGFKAMVSMAMRAAYDRTKTL